VISRSDSAPIADALVKPLDAPSMTVSSGPGGGFSLRLATATRLLAVRIGFAPETVSVTLGLDTLTIRLRPVPLTLDPIIVAAEPVYSAASSRAIREFDISLRPRESSQELLRLAPGLVIAQHAGGGKAEQIFLRGFDADHGTDVAISVDGTPVNMVSHAHGQGYADLHFLMPEVVEIGEIRKGPYDAQGGDSATAGAVTFRTKDRIVAPLVGESGWQLQHPAWARDGAVRGRCRACRRFRRRVRPLHRWPVRQPAGISPPQRVRQVHRSGA